MAMLNIISWKSYIKLTVKSAGKNLVPQPVYTLYAHTLFINSTFQQNFLCFDTSHLVCVCKYLGVGMGVLYMQEQNVLHHSK